jgi:selenide, water dikinase
VLHAADIAEASGRGLELWADQVPVMNGVRACMEQGLIPGGTHANLAHATQRGLAVDASVSKDDLLLVNDAQTSGGLLLVVPPGSLGRLIAALTRAGESAAAVVGRLTTREGLRVTTRDHPADTGDCDCDCEDGTCHVEGHK